MKTATKTLQRAARRRRISGKVRGSTARPRLSIFRSSTRIFAQIIDDTKGNTLVSVSSDKETGKTQKERALSAAKTLAEKAQKAGIKQVVFDRGGYAYFGTIKAFADAAREAGLQF
jgi:large subunit ribosomal protein L18